MRLLARVCFLLLFLLLLTWLLLLRVLLCASLLVRTFFILLLLPLRVILIHIAQVQVKLHLWCYHVCLRCMLPRCLLLYRVLCLFASLPVVLLCATTRAKWRRTTSGNRKRITRSALLLRRRTAHWWQL